MNWVEFHSKSEAIASEASLAVRRDDLDSAEKLYRQAAEYEIRALDVVDRTKIRTRGITAVSAVALCFKGREYGKAEQLAYAALADSSLPEFARLELKSLLLAIWSTMAEITAQSNPEDDDSGHHETNAA